METQIKAQVHWHDSKSGDGMIRCLNGDLVFFNCRSVADLSQGETVYGTLYQDTTFIQFELDTSRL